MVVIVLLAGPLLPESRRSLTRLARGDHPLRSPDGHSVQSDRWWLVGDDDGRWYVTVGLLLKVPDCLLLKKLFGAMTARCRSSAGCEHRASSFDVIRRGREE